MKRTLIFRNITFLNMDRSKKDLFQEFVLYIVLRRVLTFIIKYILFQREMNRDMKAVAGYSEIDYNVKALIINRFAGTKLIQTSKGYK